MAEGAGFTIVNLGTDTSADEFIRAATDHDAEIIGMSALLTTTMIYMKTVVDTVRAKGIDVKIACGGAPVTQKFATAEESIDLGYALVGTVDTVTRALEANMKRQPVDWLFCYTYNALVPHKTLMKSTEAFWTKVMPRFA